MSEVAYNELLNKLKLYKKKYYTNSLIKGAIFSAALIFTIYILFNAVEYIARLDSIFRLGLLLTFIGISVYSFSKWLLVPLLQLLNINNQLSDEEAAKQIGQYFPEVKDKLVNTIQLSKLSDTNDLIKASVLQKTSALAVFPFIKAVSFKENKKYSKYLIIPLLIILLGLLLNPDLFISSTERIINYNKVFVTPAPFYFHLETTTLQAYKNEDFKVSVSLSGESLPSIVNIVSNEKKSKLVKDSLGNFTYLFRNIQKPENFYFEAAGFTSSTFTVNVSARPSLLNFEVSLQYPGYLKKAPETLKNVGNLVVPEGTVINWNFETDNTRKLSIILNKESFNAEGLENGFNFTRQFKKSAHYGLKLSNDTIFSKEEIQYFVDVIPDLHPTISLTEYKDTNAFELISLAGMINDDYGFSKLQFFYSKASSGEIKTFPPVSLKLDRNQKNQRFHYLFNLDTLGLLPGEQVEYFVKVWDNDGVNGAKATQSTVMKLKLPNAEELAEQLNAASNQNENNIDKMLQEAKGLQKELEKIEEKIKSKNNLGWQEKQAMEKAMKSHQALKDQIQKLQEENKGLNQKYEKFNKVDPEISFKLDQLQKLMNELLDEETKKLYDEIQKLLSEKADKNEVQNMLDKLQKKDENLANELERTLEMFKQMKFEKKLDETVKGLKELAEEQKELSEKSLIDKENKLEEKQNQLNEEFKNIEKKIEELAKDADNELKEELKNSEDQQNQIKENQNKSLEDLKNGKQKKASENQKKAADKMEELAKKIEDQQNSMGMDQAQENIDDLRSILDNLITLSFEQEDLMKEFKKVHQSDPRFIPLSQKQLKLKDDSKIIEDSLLSLAKRVFQIESFVTREVGLMKDYMDESSEALKNRRPDVSVGKQQFAMTSINNLALLLNDVLKQMQEQMANSMPSSGKMCNKPNKKGNSQSLGELQKQLNSKIDKLKQSGKTGKQLSEELAQLAAQQEMIRNALKELEKLNANGEKNEGTGSGNQLSKLKKQMEETETDLVNKKLSQQTVQRQQEILTRLLEAEKAAKERELDDQRESNTGKDFNGNIPPSIEKYLKEKQNEVDLLKTISPSFTPFYKEEVNEYFKKIEK